MAREAGSRLAVPELLEAVEAVAAADAVDEFAGRLAELFGACRVAFLIADMSGRAVVRLTRADESRSGPDAGAPGRIPLGGSVYRSEEHTSELQSPVHL